MPGKIEGAKNTTLGTKTYIINPYPSSLSIGTPQSLYMQPLLLYRKEPTNKIQKKSFSAQQL
jgi:hypothetical protein